MKKLADFLNRKVNINSDYIVKILWIILRAVLIVGISYVILFPLFTKLSSSLMMERDLFDRTVRWIPRNFTFENYIIVWENMKYEVAFLNSFLLTLGASILQVISCALVGYGLGRYNFMGSGIIFALVILTLLVPPQVIMIPLFLNFRFFDLFGLIPGGGVNLARSVWPILFLSVTANGLKNGLFIYVFRQFFRGMPRGLEEASYVDGAGQLKTFYWVMLPGALPAIVVVFLFSFVWQWNDDFYIRIFLREATLLSNTLRRLAMTIISEGGGPENVSHQYMSLLNNTGSLLFILPLIIIFIFMQRYFIESIERTGIVG